MDGKSFVLNNQELQNLVKLSNKDLVVESTNAKLSFNKLSLNLNIDNLKLHKENKQDVIFSNLNASISPFRLQGRIKLSVQNIELKHFLQIHENLELSVFIDNFIEHNHLISSGDVFLEFSALDLKKAIINITSNEGWHDPLVKNLPKLQLQELDISIFYENDKVSVNKFVLAYQNSFQLNFSGYFRFKEDKLLQAEYQTNLNNFPVEYLHGLWHPKIVYYVQNWVTQNIKKGVITNLIGKFNFTGEDLAATNFRKEAVDIKMQLNNIEVNYLPNYSPISQVSGELSIDGSGVYLNNATGNYLNTKLDNISMAIPFNTCEISISSNANGNTNDFSQFLPDFINQNLLKLNIDYKKLKGSSKASFNIKIPLLEEFSFKNFSLNVNSLLSNILLEDNEILEFQTGTLSLINNKEGIEFKIQGDNATKITYSSMHDIQNPLEFNTYFGLTLNPKKPIIIANKLHIGSIIKSEFKLNHNQWIFNLNLDSSEILSKPITYSKNSKTPLSFDCSGEYSQEIISAQKCLIKGKGDSGTISFNYSIPKDRLTDLQITNLRLGLNDLNFSISEAPNNTSKYTLKARYLDLTDFSLKDLFSSKDTSSNNFDISVEIDKIFILNKSEPYSVKAKILQKNNAPIDIDLSIKDSSKYLTLTKILKNNQLGYLLHSTDASTFAKDFNLYNNMKKGELWLEMHPQKVKNNITYIGNVKLINFAFTNTSPLTKIIMGITSPLNSPRAFINSLKSGSLQADTFTANLSYANGVLAISHGNIEGPSYGIKINGFTNFDKNYMEYKGVYVPSIWGLNALITDIPLLGKLLAGGKDSSVIGANFSIIGDLKNPNFSFNPLSVLAPGFLKDIF